jgi:hypothetical protein
MKTLKGTTGDYSRATLAKEIGLLSVSVTLTPAGGYRGNPVGDLDFHQTYQGRQREPGY